LYCPVCKKAMIILEYDQVELDYCPYCAGCWLDQGELELLLDMPSQALDLSAITAAPRSKKRCPRCRKKLLRENFPYTDVEVDICPRDGGIWLDAGELVTIAQSRCDNFTSKQLKDFFYAVFKKK
jgi:Zn-finger nucleic acid-binding protein